MKCTHVCAAQKAYLLFAKLYIEPDFPSLADEIAEPHPDMNIKVAAFTESEKSRNSTLARSKFYRLAHYILVHVIPHRRTAKTHTNLCIRTVSPEPSLITYTKCEHRERSTDHIIDF